MKKLLLAILADGTYSDRLSDYINNHKNLLDYMTFTSAYNLKLFIKHSKIDILLADNSMVSAIPDTKNIQKVIILSDGEDTQDYPIIFKYQPAGDILKEIFAKIADDDTISGTVCGYPVKKQAEITVVFSAFGGAGASTYARKLCSDMATNQTVLYINMEIFDSFAEFEKVSKDEQHYYIRGMSDAIFYLKQKKNNLAFKLESLINHHSDGYSYILPVEDYRDLYSITKDDIEHLVSVLCKETIYEKIVFDIGYINETSLKLFDICDVLLLPEPSGEIQKNKQDSLNRLLMRNGMKQVLDKAKCVLMKERSVSY